MRLNLSSVRRPTLTGVRELPNAGRLAAWGTAALTGAVSPDEAADEVAGSDDAAHRVHDLPGEPAPVNLAYAFGRLRALGATGLRLVLPVPGDVSGLPGPPAFNERAVGRAAAVLTVGRPSLALLPETRGTWSVHDVADDRRTTMSLGEASHALAAAMREATEVLARLDVARFEPGAARALAARSAPVHRQLPASVDPQAHLVLQQALWLTEIVDLAGRSDGAAVNASEMAERTRVLRDLERAARRALEAACSPTMHVG
jgi:hypothetical protein